MTIQVIGTTSMRIGSVEYKVFKAWCVGNPTGTISDWCAFWDALKDLVEVRGI